MDPSRNFSLVEYSRRFTISSAHRVYVVDYYFLTVEIHDYNNQFLFKYTLQYELLYCFDLL